MKYFKAKAIKSFFRNGQLISKGQVMELDKEAKKQLVNEECLMELFYPPKGKEANQVKS